MLFHKLLLLALLAHVYCSGSSESSESSHSSSSSSSSEDSSSSSSGSGSESPASSGENSSNGENNAAIFELPYGMSAYERHPRLQEYHQCINKCINNLKEQKLQLNLFVYQQCEKGCYAILNHEESSS